MYFEETMAIVRRVRDLTAEGKLHWRRDPDGWYSAPHKDRRISFRLLNYEATNQIGADPRMFEFTMPWFNHVFAFGTEGACLLFEILGLANQGFASSAEHSSSYKSAIDWLDSP